MLGEQAFAHAIHRFLQGSAIQRRCFQVDWTGHASVVTKLRVWVERNLAPVIERALGRITGDVRLRLPLSDVHRFVALAVSNLGRSRTLNLFNYIKAWPASMGAILDIREYLGAGGQSAKAHVCHSFSEQIQKRLLHAGASTAEVLSIYVNVIHAFKTLDSRGVLLEKVAVPIRNYLRGREDTVSIIAASFLANVDLENNVSSSDMDKVCPDITLEVANSTLEDNRENKMLNWNDMEWTPDPIDAGPNYKSSKSEDVIAYILGLFEQEEFIKEVTAVLAQHLLHGTDAEFVKETRLVELFKSRLDASKLQAAEVMLKDVRDSVILGRRINPRAVYENASTRVPPPTPREIQAAIPEDGITLSALFKMFEGRMKSAQFIAAVKLVANKRNDLFFPKRTRVPLDASVPAPNGRREGEVDFKAQILSSFFWPQLRSNGFLLPASLSQYCKDFEDRFHSLGSQRRLHFRPALARVSLKLELEDRVVQETDVAAWRASVIDLFTRNDSTQQNHDEPIHLDVETIATTLNMESDLVHDALNFWLAKKVLYEVSPGTYAVLERLDMDVAASAPPLPPQQEEAMSAVVSQGAMLRESAAMFEVFIANMLRNQGAKAIGGMMGITNLLKMVLPGFTYGDDEVAWLLGEMEGRGEVVRNGELWSVA
ncbi:hypothetical protein BDY17DRAFT_253473 [Neohortaea acidophila]|uniref:Cullin family profile domain-containing protein n=1 Tax=Neohortaea acidophila TaxID=245834 RepID=A0A6A6PPX2_9PEZI|nr:uncharacterized protein BDY17DRAFT_253473 [Neohortaea acidophila]KAF2481846.1 hypothetical protein BDY17DRAFT_253473 [Neohortaea acidophila]